MIGMKNILLLIFIFLFGGCIDDDGNYTYNPTRELDVKMDRDVTLTAGEVVILNPKVFVKGDADKTEIENAGYEWSLEHEIVSREKTYTFEAKSNGSYAGMLKVIDPLTETVSCFVFSITVQSKYEMGFLVLAEKDGKTDLSIIRAKEMYEPDTVIYDREWTNIYVEANNGQQLKGKPKSLTEHWVNYEYGEPPIGEVTVLTEEGDQVYVQELNGESMKRETFIEQEFKDNKLPVNFKPKKVIHTCFDSFILDESGVVYMRRSESNMGFHTGYFSEKVKLWNGQKFTDLLFTQYHQINAILAIEEDKQGNHNYVGIYSDEYWNGYNLRRLSIVGEYADDFQNIDGELLWSDWYRMYYGASAMSVVSKTTIGDYILHYFTLGEAGETSLEAFESEKINLTQKYQITDLKGMCTNKKAQYTYLFDKNTIYAFNNVSREFSVVKKFQKEIVAIADNSNSADYTQAPASLAVAFDDGKLEIWEFTRENPAVFQPQSVYTSENNFGKIKSVIFKMGSSGNFLGR